MRVSKKLLVGALAVSALVLTACAPNATDTGPTDEGTDTPAAQEVTVGVITSETGALAGYGAQFLAGFKAGLDYATDGTGEINGTTITVDYRDDKGDADTGVNTAKELIGNGVNIITGTVVSGIALALAEQAAQNDILYISGAAAVDGITGINANTFRSGRQSAQDVATAGTFLEDIEGKKIVVLAQDNAFGQGNVAAVEAILGGQGATVEPVLVAEDVTEFTPFAQQVI